MATVVRKGYTLINSSGLWGPDRPNIAAQYPPNNTSFGGHNFILGAACAPFDALYNASGTNLLYPAIVDILGAPTNPAFADNATTSTFLAGSYFVQMTQSTAFGESTLSAPVQINLTATHSILVPAITGMNAAVTKVSIYVNGVFALDIPVTSAGSGATAIAYVSATPILLPRSAPTTDGASIDGKNIVVGFADNQQNANYPVTPWHNIMVNYTYPNVLTSAAKLYLSSTVAGALDTAPQYSGQPNLAWCMSDCLIQLNQCPRVA